MQYIVIVHAFAIARENFRYDHYCLPSVIANCFDSFTISMRRYRLFFMHSLVLCHYCLYIWSKSLCFFQLILLSRSFGFVGCVLCCYQKELLQFKLIFLLLSYSVQNEFCMIKIIEITLLQSGLKNIFLFGSLSHSFIPHTSCRMCGKILLEIYINEFRCFYFLSANRRNFDFSIKRPWNINYTDSISLFLAVKKFAPQQIIMNRSNSLSKQHPRDMNTLYWNIIKISLMPQSR